MIALVLMGMMVLLLLTLQALTQVELRSNAQHAQLIQARNNAQLAMMIALGELQESAGPDRRTTATLEVLEGKDDTSYESSMQFWTGVWKNSASYNAATNLMAYEPELTAVLVSGVRISDSGSSEFERTTADSVQIVGAGSVNADAGKVSVPKVLLPPDTAGSLGHYAYWVSDEGVKANVVIRDRSAQMADPSGDTAAEGKRAALRMAVAPSYGVDMMHGMEQFPAGALGLDSVVLPRQLSAVASSADIASSLKTLFHDVTIYSYGLLADQRRGGLRKDLSYLLNQGPMTEHLWPGGPGFERIRQYATYALGQSGVVPQVGTTSPVDTTGIYPIVTQFYLYFNVVQVETEPGTWRFELEVYPIVVLYNPYNVDFTAAPMRIQFVLPDAMVNLAYKEATGMGTTMPREGDFLLSDALGDKRQLWLDILDLHVPAGEAVVLSVDGMGVPYRSLGHPLVQSAVGALGFIKVQLGEMDGNEPAGEASEITWRIVLEEAPTNDLRRLSLNTRNRSHQLYQEVKQYPALVKKPTGTPPNIAAEPSGTPAGGFAYSMAVLSSEQPLPVYASLNPRAHSAQQRLFSGGIRMGAANIILPQTDDGDPFVGFVFGTDMGGSHELSAEVTKAILFDANRYGLISLGQLQHMDLSVHSSNTKTSTHAPAHIFGNSAANPYVARTASERDNTYLDLSYYSNEALWDGYYFSTVPQKQTGTLPEVLSNSRLNPIPPVVEANGDFIGTYAPAELLWIDGAFNVNSTSVEAWVALLSALRDRQDGGLIPRFVAEIGSAGMSVEAAPAGLAPEAWNSIRKLTDAQVVEVAQAIVDEVKVRGPFLSVAHFVNRELAAGDSGLNGAIQAALDKTTINSSMRNSVPRVSVADATLSPGMVAADNYASYRAEGDYYIDFLRGAPGLLAQADILTLIGPVISARSDTFVIRAYGDVVDPSDTSKVLASAWCEAVVQRYPDRIDGDVAAIAADAEQGGGRRFHIIHFNWLSSDDI